VEKGEKLLEIPGHVKIEVKEESIFVYFIISLYTDRVSCLSIFIPIVRIEMTAGLNWLHIDINKKLLLLLHQLRCDRLIGTTNTNTGRVVVVLFLCDSNTIN
jgi:hypothetical protein